MKEQYCYTWHV